MTQTDGGEYMPGDPWPVTEAKEPPGESRPWMHTRYPVCTTIPRVPELVAFEKYLRDHRD